MKRELIITQDGSATFYIPELNEQYHSHFGAKVESEYIYIEQAYLAHSHEPSRVLEIGFGTGLNAACTALQAYSCKRHTQYISYEKYPLSESEIHAYSKTLAPAGSLLSYFDAIHAAEWNTPVAIHPYFTIEKRLQDVHSVTTFPTSTVIYFDAFAPDKQADMWSYDLLQAMYNALESAGILVTYCVKGEVRRRMQAIGFIVEKLAGPPHGKRYIMRCTKP